MAKAIVSGSNVLDISAYVNLDSIVDRPSVHDGLDYTLIRAIANLGHVHSKSGIRYNLELAEYIDSWEQVLQRSSARIKVDLNAYTFNATAAIHSTEDCKRCKERELSFMKRTMPISYAIWGAICLLFSAVFIVMFVYGIKNGNFIIDPWLNLMLCVASVGLTFTVVIATIEWRRRMDGKSKNGQEE